ncbi:E3 SUMO-protein ligase EGR2-like isoform X1 [Artemia franciscana]|uniref:E3 SUMO-protein ligase EGR2-like isoform X1 n=1 Tax=Artemia franciscana TaxID=6661 RepID=UPI0032DAB2B5
MSCTGETIWLASVSNQSKPREKISLKTTVEIEKLTKLTIEENCCGKWRCSACGKIENTFYFLQLHKSTNCETGLSFICEICREKINNYSDFAIHYIEHEADKEKKCPICLCPNVNNIKEHLIVKKHISEDINGFKFADDECKRSNKKAKQEVFFNSNIGGYCQDRKPSFKVESNVPVQQPETSSEQPIVYDITAEILPSVETQNMEVSFTAADADTAKLSPVFNHLILDNQEQDDQGKPEFRRKKNNTLCYEFSDSDINDFSDKDIDLSERHKEDEYPAAVPLSSVLRYYSESDQKSDESCVLNDDFSDIDEFVTDEMLSELSSLPSDDLSLLDSPSKTPPQSLPVSSTDAMLKDSKKEKKNGSNGVPTPSCGTQPHIKSECPTPDPLAANAGTTVPSVTVKDEPSTPNGGESMNNCENSGSNNCATLSGQSGNTSSGPDIKPNVCGPGGGMNPMMGPNNVESNPMDNFLNDPPMNKACKAEDEGSDSDSNEDESQWTNNSNPSDAQEEYSPEFIMKYGSKSSGGIGEEKPYACPVPGCCKRYKNVDGMKYHAINGHRRDEKAYKAYKCYCGKAYKTAQGLKKHYLAHQLRVTRKVTLITLNNGWPSAFWTQSITGTNSSSVGSLRKWNGSTCRSSTTQSTQSTC